MKTTFATLALSLVSAASVACAASPFPYSVDDIKLYHLIESNTWDLTTSITERDASGNAIGSTECHAAWIDGSDYIAGQICADTRYVISLPYGARNPEQWNVIIDGPQGKAEGVISSGPKYQCGPYEGDIGNIDTACTTKNGGWFFLEQTESA